MEPRAASSLCIDARVKLLQANALHLVVRCVIRLHHPHRSKAVICSEAARTLLLLLRRAVQDRYILRVMAGRSTHRGTIVACLSKATPEVPARTPATHHSRLRQAFTGSRRRSLPLGCYCSTHQM